VIEYYNFGRLGSFVAIKTSFNEPIEIPTGLIIEAKSNF